MILLIGFPESYNYDFHKLFQKLGYVSIHESLDIYPHQYIGSIIKYNIQAGLPLLQGFEKYDAITKMDICISDHEAYWPQLLHYKELYYENKNALFILNKRNPLDILYNFKKKRLDKKLYRFNPNIIDNTTNEGFIHYVYNYYQEIESFFDSQPNSHFLSYDVDKDPIEKLLEYIKNEKKHPSNIK